MNYNGANYTVTLCFSDIPIRFRGDVQPAVRRTFHPTQCDCLRRHFSLAYAISGGTHQTTQLPRSGVVRFRKKSYV